MENAAETLFYPLMQGLAEEPPAGARILFLNAMDCEGLEFLDGSDITLQQYFKPYAATLDARPGLAEGMFDTVFILAPKNIIETQYLLACGIERLKEGGTLFCAADNDAGGGRLVKLMEAAGFIDVQNSSKNKARVVWAQKENISANVADWHKAGEMREVGSFHTQPGIFGWDKIDLGSKILLEQISSLRGYCADFGCGYGYLSEGILKTGHDIKSLVCIDADWRALRACEKNLKMFSTPQQFLWLDLTQAQPILNDLDFIVMNPPFHEGKSIDKDIGKAFIENAARALKKGGQLWMVANSRLPYEETLAGSFMKVEKKYQSQGFKVFHAVK